MDRRGLIRLFLIFLKEQNLFEKFMEIHNEYHNLSTHMIRILNIHTMLDQYLAIMKIPIKDVSLILIEWSQFLKKNKKT